jgi:hypothetical protein
MFCKQHSTLSQLLDSWRACNEAERKQQKPNNQRETTKSYEKFSRKVRTDGGRLFNCIEEIL